MSPSSRRAWIEIPQACGSCDRGTVALLAEGVDRNLSMAALVDTYKAVALLAEGVDRNDSVYVLLSRCMKSPSSRRAWIEIRKKTFSGQKCTVALLAEGVDRNTHR